MSDMEPKGLEALSRSNWAAILAAIVVLACLAGFVGGSILVSAGVSAYSGWAGVSITRVAATVVTVSGPTYTPYPTYTAQPTYTALPTYTLAPTPTPPSEPPPVAVEPTRAPPAVESTYTVQEGDTPQSIAGQFGVDIVLLILANGLDSVNPVLQPGSQIRLPRRAAELCVPGNNPVQALVASVVDGDTINVRIDDQMVSVDYIGVKAPALAPVPELFGVEALNANRSLVNSQTVTLVQDVTQADATGRLPRYVLLGERFINYEQVRQGFVNAASSPPDTACDELFALAAQQAQSEGLGLWALQTPGAQPTGTAAPTATATATIAPVVWAPPPTFTPTTTSSLGFNCNCSGKYVWGDFYNQAQADVCQAICEIAAQR